MAIVDGWQMEFEFLTGDTIDQIWRGEIASENINTAAGEPTSYVIINTFTTKDFEIGETDYVRIKGAKNSQEESGLVRGWALGLSSLVMRADRRHVCVSLCPPSALQYFVPGTVSFQSEPCYPVVVVPPSPTENATATFLCGCYSGQSPSPSATLPSPPTSLSWPPSSLSPPMAGNGGGDESLCGPLELVEVYESGIDGKGGGGGRGG